MSEITRIVLVRHGETRHSVERRWAGRNEEPLTERGRWMASRAAERLRDAGAAAVIASPLRRARETAAPIAAALAFEVATDDRLAECDFGEWDGLLFREILEGHAEAFRSWFADEGVAGGCGESLAAVAERAERWMRSALEAYDGRTVVAVTHAGPIKAVLRRALRTDWPAVYRMQQDHGSITVVEHADEGWWVRSVNDTSHLYDGSLPPVAARAFTATMEGESRPGGRGSRERVEESRASAGQDGG